VSTRAFYRHFESKDELFLAMLREETDALAERLDRTVPTYPAVRSISSGRGSPACSD
jgi:AcrR family transcriptional regulator